MARLRWSRTCLILFPGETRCNSNIVANFIGLNLTPTQKQNISIDDRAALYNKLVASHPDAVLKGATIPYTSLNGNMYSYLSKDEFVALRLGKEERDAFIKKYKTTLALSYGIIQKEYVVVPDSLLKKTDELKPYFDLSYKYVSSLKPKATTKTKKKS